MQHEVAIVGGGPAACAAALTLRSLGLSVCVVATPGQKDRPTETAVPALPGLLRFLGASEALAACEPCYGILSAWGRRLPAFQPAILNPAGHAWFIHRSGFDDILRELTRSKGVEWVTDTARTIASASDTVTITTASRRIRTRRIMIATGSPATAARLTGQKPSHLDTMVAFWARLPGAFEQRLLLVASTEHGWWYLCPSNDEAAFACFITDGATAKQLRPGKPLEWNRLFQATSLSPLVNGAIAESVNVTVTGMATLPQIDGPGWIAVGDAATRLDPLGSAGTMTSLDAGRRAALAIAGILRGSSAQLARYRQWQKDLRREFIRQRRHQYAIETRWPSSPFWSRRLQAPITLSAAA